MPTTQRMNPDPILPQDELDAAHRAAHDKFVAWMASQPASEQVGQQASQQVSQQASQQVSQQAYSFKDISELNAKNQLNMDTPPNKDLVGVPIWNLVISDMCARDAMGARKYATRLTSFNGRDPLIDAYEEMLDGAAYLRQAIFQKYGV